ncbi:MAG: glycosyltransferase, partial [Phycisphaerae bacterium]
IDDAELSHQYASAQVVLVLSRDEGFGLPVLEAMAHGCPVVAAANAALPEVVGDAGILVDPDNSDAVADAIRLMLTDPTRRGELASRALARARMFSWCATASRMREVYKLALQCKAPVARQHGRKLRYCAD